ncbi:hypothetical protein [Cupriavidus sp. AU9028]|uniref:hypothetical protein n=1 Tax=Cupriavidus sp. AU9028 TaxID=2871157 RepID=UPI001C94C03A|nr:hypothetical protein [Cupriavidus sp. AU9028]MBY4898857.1 hypothetical protein [Cupriavidus sp. AU9028]
MHSRGNEHLWATAVASGEVDTASEPEQRRFRPPLTRGDMKAMYQRNRTPEVRALLWEIARLHAIVRRAHQLAACFPLYDRESNTSAFHIILNALRRELAGELCIEDCTEGTDDRGSEVVSVDLRAARRGGSRRR